jgi:hypothetical protein
MNEPSAAGPPPGPGRGQCALAALLDDQSQRWQRGERLLVEGYLAQQPALQEDAEAVLDLLYHEIVLREACGEAVGLEDYVRRFPQWAERLRLHFQVHRALQVGPTSGPSTVPHAPLDLADQHTAPGPQAAAEWPPVPGYRILGELGRGGMSVVYLARQTQPQRLVALKMILAGGHAAADRRARFLAEADAIARLRHPQIVHIYEVGQHAGQPFLALEYVRGGSLAQRLADGPLPPRQAADLTQQLARAVAHAHRQGVIHRDLKPGNVLLTEEGQPKVSDFGLARQEGSHLTATGEVLGTPAYMAPEQAVGHNAAVGPAADVYALGAILYECLTGRAPFQGMTVLATLEQVCTQEPAAPSQLQAGLPHDLSTVCLKCLHKDPRRRYASAEALADDLQRWLSGLPIQARPVSKLERLHRWCRRNPTLATITALAALALVAVATVSLFFALYANQTAERLQGLVHDVETERDSAQKQGRLAQRRLAQSYLDRALELCEGEQNAASGLLWLVRALEALPADAPDLEWLIRMNLSAWGNTVHPLPVSHDALPSREVSQPVLTALGVRRPELCRAARVSRPPPLGREVGVRVVVQRPLRQPPPQPPQIPAHPVPGPPIGSPPVTSPTRNARGRRGPGRNCPHGRDCPPTPSTGIAL